MARRHSNFMIGLFVTVGVAIGVAAIVWVGASKYFEEGSIYVTYFDESVQGLQVDSRVKYRGVEIGKVESIGVAPDQRLVEVVMKIDLQREIAKNVVTQLRAAGITGLVFIELDQRVEGNPILMPPSGMGTRYPFIASQTSQSKQILMGVDQIISKIEKMDLNGISDQLKKTLRVAETFLNGRQMTGILAKIDSTAGSLDQGLRRIDRILAEGRVQGVLDETRQGLQEARQGLQESREAIAAARQLMAVIQDEVKNLQAAQTAEKADRLIAGLDRRTRRITADVGRTTDEIRQAVDSLKLLLDRLHANPSDLIFSRPVLEDGERGESIR